MEIICAFLSIYMLVLVARALMSWFPPPQHGGAFAQIASVIFEITEPVLAPLRRIIPPLGMFDLSFLVLFIALSLLQSQLCPGGGLFG